MLKIGLLNFFVLGNRQMAESYHALYNAYLTEIEKDWNNNPTDIRLHDL